MPKLPDHAKQCINLQGMCDFFPRLHALLSKQQLNLLAKETQMNANTLAQYKAGLAYPSLPRLAVIAQQCNVPLHWLLFGEQHLQLSGDSPLSASASIQFITLTDDAMSPTVKRGSSVQYVPILATKECLLDDGIYVITTKRGNLVRRVQWQEDAGNYLILSDNTNYPPQTVKTIDVIGRVTAIMTAL